MPHGLTAVLRHHLPVPLALPPLPSSPSIARELLCDTFAGRIDDDVLDDMVLMTTELITNAITKARTGCVLTVTTPAVDVVRIEVCDFDPTPPSIVEAGPDAVGGRGLRLVAAMSAAWGTYPDAASSSKVVWFDIVTRSRTAG